MNAAIFLCMKYPVAQQYQLRALNTHYITNSIPKGL